MTQLLSLFKDTKPEKTNDLSYPAIIKKIERIETGGYYLALDINGLTYFARTVPMSEIASETQEEFRDPVDLELKEGDAIRFLRLYTNERDGVLSIAIIEKCDPSIDHTITPKNAGLNFTRPNPTLDS